MPQTPIDDEIRAIEAVVTALEKLDDEARSRVLDYAFRRIGLVAPESVPDNPLNEAATTEARSFDRRVDIRSLRDEKQPRSANEMAALVAYYLAELAPEDERKSEITTGDIQKYFKQANHPLPNVPGQTLKNAAAAGYFDSAGRGQYRLNPVGYNLVAHGLPRGSATRATQPRRTSRKAASTKKSSKGK
jgi:hypothetical protein